jgi:predicted phosphodiesterase
VRFLVLSDLHLEFATFTPARPLEDVDAVLLAGDVLPSVKVVRWAARKSVFGSERPIVLVPGNHEYYGAEIRTRRAQLQRAAATVPNVHVLDPGEVLLGAGRVRVLGCTLWTDFHAPVQQTGGAAVSDPSRAMEEAWRFVNDYRAIALQAPESTKRRPLTPADTLAFHAAERAWLRQKLREPFDGATVVVTHHAPAAGSIASRWADDGLTPSFVSDLPDEFFAVPSWWVHGHTHSSFDYARGNCRIVCNPRGYRLRHRSFENAAFDPALVIDVEMGPHGAQRS